MYNRVHETFAGCPRMFMIRLHSMILWIGFLLELLDSLPYDQPCTFSVNQCYWNIGRRWQITQLDDDIDDQVLMATGQSEDDETLGYTDSVVSSRFTLLPSCAFHIRIVFQFYIELEQDRIELFLLKKNGSRVLSLGQWKGFAATKGRNDSDLEYYWQLANLTLLAAEEFRINIEVRHVPNDNNKTNSWFAIDDILIENCPDDPHGMTTIRSARPSTMTVLSSRTTSSYWPLENRNTSNRSVYRFRWKFNNSVDALSSIQEPTLPARFTLITFIVYFLTSLLVLALVTLISTMIIFAYRKYCFSSSLIRYRYRSRSNRKRNKFIRFGRQTQTEKTMMTTLQTLS